MRESKHIISFLILKLFLAGTVSFILLSIFSMFYYCTGLRVKSVSGATDYHWEANTLMANMKEGFAWIKTDKNGYNNATIPEEINILVMGSSHMEAV